MEKSKITFGVWEMSAMLINTFSVPVFLNFPRSMVEIGGTAGWIVTVYISAIALLLFMLITKLYKGFEGKDLLDISEIIGGGILRVIVGLVVLGHYGLIISTILREFGEDMKVITLVNSPISFVEIFFLSGMIFGAYMGIEAIVRFGAVVVPMVFIGLLIIVLGVSPYYSFLSLAPILGNGAGDIFGKGILRVSSFSELISLFMLAPYIKTHNNFKKAGYFGVGVGAFNFFISTFVYEMAYPYPSAIENFLPIYNLARIINLGRFFQRIESIFVLIWAASALLYLSLGFFVIVHTFGKTFKLPYYRPLLIPFAILVFVVSLMPPSLMSAINLEINIFRSFAWITTFALTITLLIIAGAVKKTGRKEAAK